MRSPGPWSTSSAAVMTTKNGCSERRPRQVVQICGVAERRRERDGASRRDIGAAHRYPRKSAREWKFAADLHLPGLLHGKLCLSEHAHARVLAVDTSEAERLPGVQAVLTAWNTPEYRFGSDFEDQTLFARHKVLHRGAVLAAIAARMWRLRKRRRCIRVAYEPLPAVVDVLEAISPRRRSCTKTWRIIRREPAHVRGNICAQSVVAWGDVGAGFRRPTIFEHTFTTSQCIRAIWSRWPPWRSMSPAAS